MKKKCGDPLYFRKMAIINRLVKPHYNKAMELKMLGILTKKYSFEFLETVQLHFKLKSLIWFIGNGSDTIKDFYKVYLLRQREQIRELIPLEKNKIGKDKLIKKKETLSKFLNEKKENIRTGINI